MRLRRHGGVLAARRCGHARRSRRFGCPRWRCGRLFLTEVRGRVGWFPHTVAVGTALGCRTRLATGGWRRGRLAGWLRIRRGRIAQGTLDGSRRSVAHLVHTDLRWRFVARGWLPLNGVRLAWRPGSRSCVGDLRSGSSGRRCAWARGGRSLGRGRQLAGGQIRLARRGLRRFGCCGPCGFRGCFWRGAARRRPRSRQGCLLAVVLFRDAFAWRGLARRRW